MVNIIIRDSTNNYNIGPIKIIIYGTLSLHSILLGKERGREGAEFFDTAIYYPITLIFL